MNKEDYMKLSKERLAELLAERDQIEKQKEWIYPNPFEGSFPDCCSPNGICVNPHMDCINCPKRYSNNGYWTTTTTTINKTDDKEYNEK